MHSFVWLAAMIAFLCVEAATVSIVSIWFAFGSLAAMVVTMLGAPLWLQAALFITVSTACLLALRPIVRKHFVPHLAKTNVDALIDQRGYVKTEISNERATGCVKLGAMEWTARSTGGAEIPAGTLVKVDRVEGVKVFVTPVPKAEHSTL